MKISPSNISSNIHFFEKTYRTKKIPFLIVNKKCSIEKVREVHPKRDMSVCLITNVIPFLNTTKIRVPIKQTLVSRLGWTLRTFPIEHLLFEIKNRIFSARYIFSKKSIFEEIFKEEQFQTFNPIS